jgi:isopenicillin-N N-acyltransferase-like protein
MEKVKGTRLDTNIPPIITISGSPHSRGRQYGSQCKKPIEKNIEHYYKTFRDYSNLDRPKALKYAEKFHPFIEAFDGEIVEEMKGIAEGSGYDYLDILVANCRSELMFAVKRETTPECTSFAVLPEANSLGTTLLGQNRDFAPWSKGRNIILKVDRSNRPKVVMVIEAGLVGQMGFNSKGIGLVHNMLGCEQFQIGVPYVILRRAILDSETVGDALGKVLRAKRSSSGNMMIGHASGEAINMETAPHDVDFQYPEGGIITHSNHYLSAKFSAMDSGRTRFPDSLLRRERLFKFLKSMRGKIDIESVQRALSDHYNYPDSICRHCDNRDPPNEHMETIVSLIMDLKHHKMVLTEGHPCTNSYQTLDFEDFFRDGKH